MVSHLLNIDQKLADTVALGLGLEDMPKAADAAMPTRRDLLQSDKLSILKNGPDSFKGRKMGVLMTDGADAALFEALQKEVMDKGAMLEVVAPKVGGVKDNKGQHREAQQKIDGGPSVLYDAVAIIISDEGAKKLAADATARDFVSDAYAHCKFIGYSPAAKPLLDAAGILDILDEGCVALDVASDVLPFMAMCADLRHWERESMVDQT
jgi:catalase